MYTEPALSPRGYQEIVNRRPLEAIVYRENNEDRRLQVDAIANSLLNKLRNHPYVANHGDQWRKRFAIREGDGFLEAIQKIYVSLRSDRKERHYPTLDFNSFEKLYREDLHHRENEFRRQAYHAICCLPGLSKLKERLAARHREPAPPTLLIHRLALDLKKAGCEEILWSASAAANYWEAIPSLFKHQVSWKARNGYDYPEIEQTETNRDWIAAFNARSPVQIPFEHTEPLSFHEVVHQMQRNARSRVSLFCERLSFQASEWRLEDDGDAALWCIDQYAKEKVDEDYLALNLAKYAAKQEWGNHLWRLAAATDYWEVIPILIAAGLHPPIPDAEEPRTLLKIAEQAKCSDWMESFLFHTQQSH